MTDYSCCFHHLGHARVAGMIKGCFTGQLFIQSPRPLRNPLDHKVIQRNGSECTIIVRTKWAMPQHLFGAAWRGLKQTLRLHTVRRANAGETQPSQTVLPLQAALKALPPGRCPWQQGRENGRLAGLVLLSLCSQGAAKKGTQKLSCTNHIYWCCSNGLLSIKSSPEIGTLLRKGRDPPQNTKCQETFTGWRNIHCQCNSKCSCSEDNQEAAWLVHTFHRARTIQNPQRPCCEPSQSGQRPND